MSFCPREGGDASAIAPSRASICGFWQKYATAQIWRACAALLAGVDEVANAAEAEMGVPRFGITHKIASTARHAAPPGALPLNRRRSNRCSGPPRLKPRIVAQLPRASRPSPFFHFRTEVGEEAGCEATPIGAVASFAIAEARGFLAIDNRNIQRLAGRIAKGSRRNENKMRNPA